MNAVSPRITHHRWCSLLIAIAAISSSSVTLAEDTDDPIIQQQQRNAAADVQQQNKQIIMANRISSSLIGDTTSNNNHPKRPTGTTMIQIDLDEYLNVMDNTTSSVIENIKLTTEEKDEDDAVVEKLPELPKNPAVQQFPEKRFSLWSELTRHEQDTTTRLLHYNENTWDQPMTNPLEMLSFDQLTNKMKSGLSVLRITQPEWDCHVNHYYGYKKWDDLVKVGVHIHLSMLGWTKDSWEYGNVTKPDVEWMTWGELSERQRVIANELCYFNEATWDEWPLSEWVVEWRKLNKMGEG